ncbi:hypothetical protein VAS14_17311 [Photobacterium angustum S14]|uniref:Uncharacterized protein n=1 Tax=Photobacterium angustum (strain S14 / CCUG 15956) TaxID=314292 RepID=Q1ZPC6_PHOAS|nr:hypothetical protein VAS14_17311 [Photobacterium angustum S14]
MKGKRGKDDGEKIKKGAKRLLLIILAFNCTLKLE